MFTPRRSMLLAFAAALQAAVVSADLASDIQAAGIAASFPDSDSYANATTSFNLRFDYQPAGVVFPSTKEQVATAVALAAANNVKVTAKSGGHSYIANGLGGEDGALVVDLRNMTKLTYDSDTNQATIQVGKRLGNVALELNDEGRGIGHGTCAYVGIGGHAGHGGYGFTSRMWGMALDAIVGMDVVLANGTAVTASAEENSDVFWAMRGAASSFGIATSYTLKTFEAPAYAQMINYGWNLDTETATKGLQAFQAYSLSDIPTHFGLEITISKGENFGEVLFRLVGGWYGPEGEFLDTLKPFLDSMPEPDTPTLLGDGTYIDSVKQLNGGDLDTTVAPDGHDTFYTKSIITSEAHPQSNESLAAYVKYLAEEGFEADLDWFCQIELYGGKDSAINKVPVEDTSFVRRDNLFIQQLYASAPDFLPPYPDAGFEFLDGLVEAVEAPMGDNWDHSAYLNYVDDRLENYETFYYGDNYPRLQKLKAELDPTNVFTAPSLVKAA